MTRKRLTDHIKQSIEEKGLQCKDEGQLANAVVDATLQYLLDFGQEVSQELVGVGLYSEAMVAGVFVRKIKALLHP